MTDEDLAVDQENAVEEQEALTDDEKLMAKLKEAISIDREDVGALRIKLTVTVPRDVVDERMGEQFTELKRDAQIPGFRKGHAPLALVEKRFGSDVGDQLKTQLVSNGYMAAVEKEDLKPLGDPLFWVKFEEKVTAEDGSISVAEREKLLPIDTALDHLEMPAEGPLTFACEVELKPAFELPDLKGIPVERVVASVTDDDVETELKRFRMSRGTFKPVEDGAVEADDMIYAEMTMSVDGEVIERDDNFDLAARDIRVKGVPLLGLADTLIGKKTGDTATFEAAVPDDHENIDIRGKEATFSFTLREIKRLDIPPFDEEFLSDIGFDSEGDLREVVRDRLTDRLDETNKRAMREQIGEHLIEKTAMEIPAGLSQRTTDRAVARRMIDMYQANVPEADITKAVDEMKASAREEVLHDLKLYFILEKVAEDREVDVTDEEIHGAIAHMAATSGKRFDRVRDELSKGDGLSSLYMRLRDQKVMDLLLEDADITDAKKTPKKPAKKAPKASAKKAKKKVAKKDPEKEGPKK